MTGPNRYTGFRFPAEWARQAAILLAWPTERTDWQSVLDEAQACYLDLIETIGRFEPVVLCVDRAEEASRLRDRLPETRHPVTLIETAYNDTWVRDSGPISVIDQADRVHWLDFRFDAWGGKFEHDLDDQLVHRLSRTPTFHAIGTTRFDWVLEGGAIETDGEGTLLTTVMCMDERFPNLSRSDIETRLQRALRADRVLWVEEGGLIGDDTDGHVDTLVRFVDTDALAYQGCRDRDDEHFEALAAMARGLEALSDPVGRRYRLFELPLPAARYGPDGGRLPAGYANFLILNGAVIVPTYGDAADGVALDILRGAFPDRDIVGVDCSILITQGGSLHCATMQLPAGTFATQ